VFSIVSPMTDSSLYAEMITVTEGNGLVCSPPALRSVATKRVISQSKAG
jgi:hypothetical protein